MILSKETYLLMFRYASWKQKKILGEVRFNLTDCVHDTIVHQDFNPESGWRKLLTSIIYLYVAELRIKKAPLDVVDFIVKRVVEPRYPCCQCQEDYPLRYFNYSFSVCYFCYRKANVEKIQQWQRKSKRKRVEADKRYKALYNEANKEKIRVAAALYRAKNKEKRNAYSAEYRKTHPPDKEKARLYNKAYRELNKDKLREKKREYQMANRDKINARRAKKRDNEKVQQNNS